MTVLCMRLIRTVENYLGISLLDGIFEISNFVSGENSTHLLVFSEAHVLIYLIYQQLRQNSRDTSRPESQVLAKVTWTFEQWSIGDSVALIGLVCWSAYLSSFTQVVLIFACLSFPPFPSPSPSLYPPIFIAIIIAVSIPLYTNVVRLSLSLYFPIAQHQLRTYKHSFSDKIGPISRCVVSYSIYCLEQPWRWLCPSAPTV